MPRGEKSTRAADVHASRKVVVPTKSSAFSADLIQKNQQHLGADDAPAPPTSAIAPSPLETTMAGGDEPRSLATETNGDWDGRPSKLYDDKSRTPRRANGASASPSRLPNALAPLIGQRHWVVWRWESKNGKPTKVPYQPNGRKAKNNDPQTWHTYEAVQAARQRFDGIGFCLLGSGFGAFDIDDCRNPETGELHSWAEALVKKVGSYTEVTVSGTGLRIIGRASGPKVHRKLPVMAGVSCELYRGAERYIVMTGNDLGERELGDIDDAIDTTLAELDRKKKEAPDGTAAKNKRRRSLAVGRDEMATSIPDTVENTHADLDQGQISLLSVNGPGGYPTRSELLFAFLTGALRKRVAEEVIVAACLDDRYRGCGIHEHCYENGGRSYVERQIKRARENGARATGTYTLRNDGIYLIKRDV